MAVDFYSSIRGKTVLIKDGATVKDTIRWIRNISIESANDPVIQKIAESLRGSDFLEKAVFDFVYQSAVYFPDDTDKQNIQFAERTYRDKKANCVNYTVFISALFQNLGVEHFARVVAYDAPYQWEHIYVKTKSGYTLDCVLGQKQDGTDTFFNRSQSGFFNKELPFISKKDIPMKLQVLAGAVGCCGNESASVNYIGRVSRRQARSLKLSGSPCILFTTDRCKCRKACDDTMPSSELSEDCKDICEITDGALPYSEPGFAEYMCANYFSAKVNPDCSVKASVVEQSNNSGSYATAYNPGQYTGSMSLSTSGAPGASPASGFVLPSMNELFSSKNMPFIAIGGIGLLYLINRKK